MKRLTSILSLFALCGAIATAADWQPATVPGAWEQKGPAAARNYDGVAWYRTWVKVPDQFFAKHERNLWEESAGVYVRNLADAHEVYVNGKKIGAGGQFPPNFQKGSGAVHRHKIPVGTLRKGQWNELAIRVYNQSGPGGFLGEAPFVTNYLSECELEGPWEIALGDDYRPGAALAEKPPLTSFDKFRPSSRVLGRAAEMVPGPKLSPADSAAKMRSVADLKVDLMLSEPLVAQATHLSFDARGRLWVSQYRQYPFPAGITMLSRDAYYRAQYDRVPPAPPNHDRGADIISIHEDTDGDGLYDKHKVFQDGLNMANAAVRGGGGVWVMHTPYLLFYPDANFDDIPDGPPVVHLQGFGLEDTHSVANGLVWGPDGWIYGGQGSTTTSRVTRPRLDAPNAPGVYFEGCMVWRYHPQTRAYEIFSEGSGNPFGLELDAQGRIYSGLNSGTSRGWHYVQGGFYLMQGVSPSKFGPPRNPYAFGDLPKMATTTPVRRFSHFGSFAEGTALPAKYQGHLFALDPLHNEIIDVERHVQGASFETTDLDKVVWSEDVAFRPIYSVNAPDGSMLISDMYEYYIAHGQHYQSQLDPTTGRIYRVRGADAKLERDISLEKKTSAELVGLLSHPNKWHRQMAAQLLGERKDRSVVPALRQEIAKSSGLGGMAAVWTLQQMDAFDDAAAQTVFQNRYAPARMWAVRLVGDKYGMNRGLGLAGIGGGTAHDVPAGLMNAMTSLTKRELNAEVRAQIASTARRLTTPQALALVTALIVDEPAGTDAPLSRPTPALASGAAGRASDAKDPYIPLLTWWILEAHIAVDREAVLSLFQSPKMWEGALVQEHLLPRLMRRFALEGRRQDLLVCARLLKMAPTPAHTVFLMKGFEEAYRGREMAGLPDELLTAMAATGQAPLILRVRQGDAAAVQEALATVQNKKAPIADRAFYARVFGEIRSAAAAPVLLALATGTEPAALRKAALISLMGYEQKEIGPQAVAILAKAPTDVRVAALALLASRANWSLDLLNAVQKGEVAVHSLPRDIVDRIRGHQDPAVAQLVAKLYPPVAPSGIDFNRRIAEVEAIIKTGPGNPYAGEATFMARCAACHRLFFKGGKVGPDLTNYQRDNLGTMLISIINPNAEIREGFEYNRVETNDGRSLSGFLVERDPQIAVLRGLEGEDITLRSSEIKDLQPVGRSLMPEGLLEGLEDRELRDFFAYLRNSQPITK